MYRVASLFCGCGGSDLGIIGNFKYNNKVFKKLPYELVYALDIDKNAILTHQRNFQCSKVICGDITNINSNQIPDHDVLIGGFPCQSFSTVNPTKNPFDDRANLYKQMARILEEKQPKAFIAENVKGLMTLHKGGILKNVINAFEKAGYTVYWKLINAADYGVPQKRERIIIVGIRSDIEEPFSFPNPITPNKWVPLSVAVKSLIPENEKYYFSKRAVEGMKRAKNNMKRGLAQDLDKPCLTITSHLAKVSLNSRDPVLLVNKEKEIYRRFTPREAARIQSFPDSFQFVGSDTVCYKQIGNAIPPVMFWYIARQVSKILTKDTESRQMKLF